MELQSRWQARMWKAARKHEEISKRLARALKANESTRDQTDTVDEIKTARETVARELVADPLSVACKSCDVGIGADCLSKHAKTIPPHKSRLREAALSAQRKDW